MRTSIQSHKILQNDGTKALNYCDTETPILKIVFVCVGSSTVVIMLYLKCLSRLEQKSTRMELFSTTVG